MFSHGHATARLDDAKQVDLGFHSSDTGRACPQLSLRYTLNVLLAGEDAPFSMARHVVVTVGVVASSLAVALAVPNLAEKIFAVTGATGELP